MDSIKFYKWLQQNQDMNDRSAKDVISRLKRTLSIIGNTDIPCDALQLLKEKEVFMSLSVTVKSQLRRAVKLYLEFNK